MKQGINPGSLFGRCYSSAAGPQEEANSSPLAMITLIFGKRFLQNFL
jgi:hypothetical protein